METSISRAGRGSDLAGQVVLVTGAAGGIGGATARAFASAGARLVLTDIRADAGGQFTEQMRRGGADVLFVPADVTDGDAVSVVAESAVERFGTIDALVHIAGASGRRRGDGPVHVAAFEAWEWVMSTNLHSAFHTAKAVLPAMLRAGSGSITFLSSVQALAGGGRAFDAHGYATAKTGLLGLTRAMATYYASDGIRVNAICAGTILTAMSARVQDDPEVATHVARMQPLTNGPGEPSDVAGAAVFLASGAARFVTGVALPVDGGWSAA